MKKTSALWSAHLSAKRKSYPNRQLRVLLKVSSLTPRRTRAGDVNSFCAVSCPDGAPDPRRQDVPRALGGRSLTKRANRDFAAAWGAARGGCARGSEPGGACAPTRCRAAAGETPLRVGREGRAQTSHAHPRRIKSTPIYEAGAGGKKSRVKKRSGAAERWNRDPHPTAAVALPWVCARRRPASCRSWAPALGSQGRWGRRGTRGPGRAAPPAGTPAAVPRSPGPGTGRRVRADRRPAPPPAPSPPPPPSPPSPRCCRRPAPAPPDILPPRCHGCSQRSARRQPTVCSSPSAPRVTRTLSASRMKIPPPPKRPPLFAVDPQGSTSRSQLGTSWALHLCQS